jgi:glutathione S-transferase
MLLYYIQGSPFARVARVLLREFEIPCAERLLEEFPPGPAYFDVNPLGQVPAIEDGAERYFPTSVVLSFIVSKAPRPGPSTAGVARTLFRDGSRQQDEQLLMVLLGMGDMMVAVQYQKWAGLGAVERNRLGYDPAERNMQRVYRTLDWLEQRAANDGFWPGTTSVQDVVLACLILWSESRGPIQWRGRPKLEGIVSGLDARPSFKATAPLPLGERFLSTAADRT